MNADEIIAGLRAEFPQEVVSWRAQSMTGDGTKAMALAYIDARDVQNRLDEVVGPFNWKDRFEFHGARTICYIAIRFGDEWIEKGDGAGDSDVEAEKGAISDALKRAAVKWGVGRYLYDMPSPWVPCESYGGDGKKRWKKWTADPWQFVKGRAAPPVERSEPSDPDDPLAGEFPNTSHGLRMFIKALRQTRTEAERTAWVKANKADFEKLNDNEAGILHGAVQLHKQTVRDIATASV